MVGPICVENVLWTECDTSVCNIADVITGECSQGFMRINENTPCGKSQYFWVFTYSQNYVIRVYCVDHETIIETKTVLIFHLAI